MATLVAGLPQYVVLKSKRLNIYMHYMWNDDEFGDFYEFIGTKRALDPVSPFVKLEVVPSTTNPSSFVHLRCSYNNKFFRLVQRLGVWMVTATADNPNEDTSVVGECTLFEPFFPSDQPDTVWFRYVANQGRLFWFNNPDFPDEYGMSIVYSQEERFTTYYDYAPWESYEDKMRAKDAVIQARDVEIRRLAAEVADNGEEIKTLRGQLADRDGEIVKLEGQVASWEAYVEKRKVKLEDGMVTLQSAVAAAWEAFQDNVSAGIGKIKGGLGRFGKVLKLQKVHHGDDRMLRTI
ncbi:unnamed protein product [Linum tenue]|uniref:Agglutinin domain-containing protein n=1 Tax=Linum tenue TaxID=586396 RepID=A0AAV0KJ93_9ROSI|nr:unnamed protein product [Linum tenue]